MENAARGAALGTGTEVEWEIIHGNYNILPNIALARVMQDSLEHFGGIDYDKEEQRFAEALVKTYTGKPRMTLGSEKTVLPFTEEIYKGAGSSDVGDVSPGRHRGGVGNNPR